MNRPCSPSPRRRLPRLALAAYLVLCTAALIWPCYDILGNSVEPYLLGLPLVFAWNVSWVVLTFFALLGFHLLAGGRGRGS